MIQTQFMRETILPQEAAPHRTNGVLLWVRENLFSSVMNSVLTLLSLWALYATIPGLFQYLIVDAVWSANTGKECLVENVGRPVGVCWAFVTSHMGYFIYGQYPEAEWWRVDLFFAAEALGIVWLLWPNAPYKFAGIIYFFVIFPIIGFVSLTGSTMLGLTPVATNFWGGFLVTIVISTFGIVVSLPVGVLLALGRRSDMPIVRLVSVIFIEFVRGVPLITVLFMANVMFPLFLPDGWRPDSLLRVLVGVAFFFAAYMAEAVRGGLQAIPRGQYEAAQALGLGYWRMMIKIILPQALKIVIPNIVNNFIGLFKDTTLVAIVGIFDFLKTIQASLADPVWRAAGMPFAAYIFASLVFFVFCYGMARYSMWMEARLDTGKRH